MYIMCFARMVSVTHSHTHTHTQRKAAKLGAKRHVSRKGLSILLKVTFAWSWSDGSGHSHRAFSWVTILLLATLISTIFCDTQQ